MKTLKIFVLLLCCLPVSLFAQNPNLALHFDKHLGEDGYTKVKITSKMFEMMADIDIDDEDFREFKEVVAGLKGIHIYASDDEQNVRQKMALATELQAKLASDRYEDLIVVEDKEENVRIVIKESGNGLVEELLILAQDEEEIAAISIFGTLDLNKIAQLSSKVDIDGLEHLEKMDEKCNK